MYTKLRTKSLRFKRNIIYQNLVDNINYAADIAKTQSDNMINMSVESALDRSIQMMKIAEEKIKTEKLNDTNITINFAVGPIQFSMSRTIE